MPRSRALPRACRDERRSPRRADLGDERRALGAPPSERIAGALDAPPSGFVACTTCHLLSHPGPAGEPDHCPRCGSGLIARRPRSIEYTWALVIAAAILYIPANALPVLVTNSLGSTESDTIISGVIYLYHSGSPILALIVLVASVVIPLGKLVALGYLCMSVQRGWVKNNHDRTRLYRMVELIGRWSMLDVFVDAFIVAMVQLQPLMSVEPGSGVVYFMVVVVLTMLAAQTFDPRLIWDARTAVKRRRRG